MSERRCVFLLQNRQGEKNMRGKLIKKIGRSIGVVLAIVLLANVSVLEVSAANNTEVEDVVCQLEATIHERNEPLVNGRTFLYNCLINVLPSSAGMWIDFCTDCNQTATTIGVKDITIEKKVWYGWKIVATSSGAEESGTHTFGCSINYTGAERGETYRIKCTHYASADEYREVDNELEFVFTY